VPALHPSDDRAGASVKALSRPAPRQPALEHCFDNALAKIGRGFFDPCWPPSQPACWIENPSDSEPFDDSTLCHSTLTHNDRPIVTSGNNPYWGLAACHLCADYYFRSRVGRWMPAQIGLVHDSDAFRGSTAEALKAEAYRGHCQVDRFRNKFRLLMPANQALSHSLDRRLLSPGSKRFAPSAPIADRLRRWRRGRKWP
jgi:hypothetical protein